MRRLPVTEAPHPRGSDLERLSAGRLLSRLHAGDREAVRAVGRALPSLAGLSAEVADALRAGGRLIYAGAGTSGRLGALDAAECPPTFGVAPSRVLALVAGGARALRRAIEGAEDDAAAGRVAVARARVGARDVVVGVSASGRTPFVAAALAEARRRGARTALVTSNPAARAAADRRVVLPTGPELVAGSTRMKAGTAAKMALGLLSTAVFVQLGAVREGRMVALGTTSAKLRDRAVRNVMALAGLGARPARALLDACGWSVREAVERAGETRATGRGTTGRGARTTGRGNRGTGSGTRARAAGSGSGPESAEGRSGCRRRNGRSHRRS
ncbi:N-acetylmuramic acid 6-phosphate etherase [Anaeromyxobacter oryzisoli]|uniref:N-acetylmuramic acid 6-phosphate etherase n=1 Tax=Anaeromyxobacter oryzisoli TaxID=2925408 RepID=UPI001F5A2BA6|nr:N-acetylmuramic acid 6-phosphate etherase [Anaeromyxobacter sp. SG63]